MYLATFRNYMYGKLFRPVVTPQLKVTFLGYQVKIFLGLFRRAVGQR